MEELAKKLQQRYVDDITAKYPLHRFLCLYLYLLAFYIFYSKKDVRFIGSIKEIKVDFLFDFDKGLLAQVNIFDLVVAVIMTFITAFICKKIKLISFKCLSSIKDFDNYLVKLKTTIGEHDRNSAVTYTMTADVSRSLDIKRSILKSKQAISEIVVTLILCALIGAKNMIYVDWILVFGGVAIVLMAQWESFKVYISEFLPYFVAEQILLGKNVSFSKSPSEPHT
ncbi:MAG: hypothetical protein ACI8SR_002857 [Oceanicoccus sp.]|jgi:hypothetical protein